MFMKKNPIQPPLERLGMANHEHIVGKAGRSTCDAVQTIAKTPFRQSNGCIDESTEHTHLAQTVHAKRGIGLAKGSRCRGTIVVQNILPFVHRSGECSPSPTPFGTIIQHERVPKWLPAQAPQIQEAWIHPASLSGRFPCQGEPCTVGRPPSQTPHCTKVRSHHRRNWRLCSRLRSHSLHRRCHRHRLWHDLLKAKDGRETHPELPSGAESPREAMHVRVQARTQKKLRRQMLGQKKSWSWSRSRAQMQSQTGLAPMQRATVSTVQGTHFAMAEAANEFERVPVPVRATPFVDVQFVLSNAFLL